MTPVKTTLYCFHNIIRLFVNKICDVTLYEYCIIYIIRNIALEKMCYIHSFNYQFRRVHKKIFGEEVKIIIHNYFHFIRTYLITFQTFQGEGV